ncbi:MAG: protein kinase [Tepidisphaeraceae bacterium]
MNDPTRPQPDAEGRDPASLPPQMSQAAPETARPYGDGTAMPKVIGPYHILDTLGRGGMGEIYKAERRSPYRQTVALKLIKLGYDSREVIARFDSERQALARMDHPNIARVLDAGVSDSGRPYFVMEYVPGVPVTRFADENRLTVKQRLTLFKHICDAIAHAHIKQVIHRDIKAANVLAYMKDGSATVKVIDFGIAKALTSDRLTEATFNTRGGQVIGTYSTMSPEQAGASPDIDTRTDVYSLGALLYELLAGAQPFDPKTLAKAAEEEIRRIIREQEPPRPSTRLTALGDTAGKIAAARQIQLSELQRTLRGELDWIPLKAMRKERDRRYSSAQQLGEDIDNYLSNRPLIAAPEGRIYRFRKYARRNRAALIAVACVMLALILGIAGTTAGFLGQRRLRIEAELSAAAAKTAADAAKTAADNERKAKEEAESRLVDALRAQAGAESLTGDAIGAHQLLDQAWQEANKFNLPTFAIEMVMLECEHRQPSPITTFLDKVRGGAVVSGGNTMLSVGADKKSISCWDALTGRVMGTFVDDTPPTTCAAISRSGMLAASANSSGQLMIWTVPECKLVRKINADLRPIYSVAISPDSKLVATGGDDRLVKLFDVASGRQLWSAEAGGSVRSVCFDQQGGAVFSGDTGSKNPLRKWGATGAPLGFMPIPTASPVSLDVSPDNKLLVVWTSSLNIQVWKLPAWERALSFKLGGGSSVRFSPDEKALLAGTWSGQVQLRQFPSGEIARTISGDIGTVICDFFPCGDLCWSSSGTREPRTSVWNLHERSAVLSLNPENAPADISPNGRLIVVGGERPSVWDSATGKRLLEIALRPDAPSSSTGLVKYTNESNARLLKFLDSRRLVVRDEPDGLGVWDIYQDKQIAKLRKPPQFGYGQLAVSPDGNRIAMGGVDGSVLVWDAQGRLLFTLPADRRGVSSLSFSPDSKRIASNHTYHTVLWDADTGQSAGKVAMKGGRTLVMLNDHEVVEGDLAGNLFVLNLQDGSQPLVFDMPPYQIYASSISHDCQRFVTYSSDDMIRLWKADQTKELYAFRGLSSVVNSVYAIPSVSIAMSSDGNSFVTSDDHGVCLWDLTRMREQYDLRNKADGARTVLQQNPNDAAALLALGQWYEFRGAWTWATQLLELARAHGLAVSSLSLARDYWQMGDFERAGREFSKALERREADEEYIQLCVRAMTDQATHPTTTLSAP